jgi:hypothetical protein
VSVSWLAGVQLDTIGDMLASLVANGFCSNTAHFGSGGGLLQKVNRDSLSCAFKCAPPPRSVRTPPNGTPRVARWRCGRACVDGGLRDGALTLRWCAPP